MRLHKIAYGNDNFSGNRKVNVELFECVRESWNDVYEHHCAYEKHYRNDDSRIHHRSFYLPLKRVRFVKLVSNREKRRRKIPSFFPSFYHRDDYLRKDIAVFRKCLAKTLPRADFA